MPIVQFITQHPVVTVLLAVLVYAIYGLCTAIEHKQKMEKSI